MLGLHLPTDPRWANLAEKQLADILSDHAYCEQKAVSTCISLIQTYPEKEALVEVLSPIVAEEWSHFRLVLAELKRRGLAFGRQRKDLYVNELMKLQRKGNVRWLLLDRLLTSALIEARSCERFRLLSEQLEDAGLRAFYRTFMESEAGHYRTFMDLARMYLPKEEVEQRWQYLLREEKEIMHRMELRGDRMH